MGRDHTYGGRIDHLRCNKAAVEGRSTLHVVPECLPARTEVLVSLLLPGPEWSLLLALLSVQPKMVELSPRWTAVRPLPRPRHVMQQACSVPSVLCCSLATSQILEQLTGTSLPSMLTLCSLPLMWCNRCGRNEAAIANTQSEMQAADMAGDVAAAGSARLAMQDLAHHQDTTSPAAAVHPHHLFEQLKGSYDCPDMASSDVSL